MFGSFTIKKLSHSITAIIDCLGYPSYLIEGNQKAMLVDTGFGVGDISKEVDKLTKKDIVVVNTHAHVDHSGGNGLFEKVAVGMEDIPALEQINKALKKEFAKKKIKDEKMLENFLQNVVSDRSYLKMPVVDGEEICLGDCTIQCISTKGHTKGSTCFYYKEEEILFTGDFIKPFGVWMFLEESTNLEVYYEELKKVSALGVKKICPGHQPSLIDVNIIVDLVKCAEIILENPQIGEEKESFAGTYMSYAVGEGEICYSSEKVLT